MWFDARAILPLLLYLYTYTEIDSNTISRSHETLTSSGIQCLANLAKGTHIKYWIGWKLVKADHLHWHCYRNDCVNHVNVNRTQLLMLRDDCHLPFLLVLLLPLLLMLSAIWWKWTKYPYGLFAISLRQNKQRIESPEKLYNDSHQHQSTQSNTQCKHERAYYSFFFIAFSALSHLYIRYMMVWDFGHLQRFTFDTYN